MIPLAVVLSVLMILFTKKAVLVLMGDPSAVVLKNADEYMLVISLFYFLCFTGSTFVGLFRGIGRVEVPVIGTFIQMSIRVVLSYTLSGLLGLKAIALATGLGWSVIVMYQILTSRKMKKDLTFENGSDRLSSIKGSS